MCDGCGVSLLRVNFAPAGKTSNVIREGCAMPAESLYRSRDGSRDGGLEKGKRPQCKIQIAFDFDFAVDVLCAQRDVVGGRTECVPRILRSQADAKGDICV